MLMNKKWTGKELLFEGLARELIHVIQTKRKEIGNDFSNSSQRLFTASNVAWENNGKR